VACFSPGGRGAGARKCRAERGPAFALQPGARRARAGGVARRAPARVAGLRGGCGDIRARTRLGLDRSRDVDHPADGAGVAGAPGCDRARGVLARGSPSRRGERRRGRASRELAVQASGHGPESAETCGARLRAGGRSPACRTAGTGRALHVPRRARTAPYAVRIQAKRRTARHRLPPSARRIACRCSTGSTAISATRFPAR